MGIALTKTVAAAAITGVLALTASVAPASAAGGIWHHGGGGGWHGGHGGGWHGGYGGGWRGGYGGWRGGGWGGGWAPFVVGGLAAGAILGAAAPYYADPYYGYSCNRLAPTYDQWGRYAGRQWVNVCQ